MPDYLFFALQQFAREHAMFLAASTILLCFTSVGSTIVWLRAHYRDRRVLALALERQADSLARLEQRMASVVNAVDTVALEVERIGEGQRFASRVLSDRSPPVDSAPRQGRTPTPH